MAGPSGKAATHGDRIIQHPRRGPVGQVSKQRLVPRLSLIPAHLQPSFRRYFGPSPKRDTGPEKSRTEGWPCMTLQCRASLGQGAAAGEADHDQGFLHALCGAVGG